MTTAPSYDVSPAWVSMTKHFPSGLHPISVAADGTNGWVVGSDNFVYLSSFDGTNYTWSQVASNTCPPTVAISVESLNHNAAILDNYGVLWLLAGNWSSQSATGPYAAVSIGNLDNICATDSSGDVLLYDSENTLSVNYLYGYALNATVSNTVDVWGLDPNTYHPIRYTGNSTNPWSDYNSNLAQGLSQIQISTDGATVVGADSYGDGWQYDFTSGEWLSVLPPPNTEFVAMQASANNGGWLCLGVDNNVYYAPSP